MQLALHEKQRTQDLSQARGTIGASDLHMCAVAPTHKHIRHAKEEFLVRGGVMAGWDVTRALDLSVRRNISNFKKKISNFKEL